MKATKWEQLLDEARTEADNLRSACWSARKDVEDLAQKRHDLETALVAARAWVAQYESLPDHAPAARAMVAVIDRALGVR